MKAQLKKFFYQPMSERGLFLVRFVLGLSMLAEWIFISQHLESLFGPTGFLQADLMAHITGWSLPLAAGTFENYGIPYSTVLFTFSVLRYSALAGLITGYSTRLSTAVLWVTQVLLIQSGANSSYGIDKYYLVLLFILMLAPTTKYRFTDWWRNTRSSVTSDNRFIFRIIQLAILIIYIDAGVSKAFGLDWWTGDAIWRALHLPEFHHLNFYWMADYPIVPKLLCWGTLFFEAFYIVGVWVPRWGKLWALNIIAMHLGIAALMGLHNFGLTLAALNFALFIYQPEGQVAPSRSRLRTLVLSQNEIN